MVNRWIGNPILTGHAQPSSSASASRTRTAACARFRRAAPSSALDLHSTGMEFASEMVFKAFRRDLAVSEIPIDYYPRIGESKLSRFGDAWRHVRFMLLYCPSWLFFVPGRGAPRCSGRRGMSCSRRGPSMSSAAPGRSTRMLAFVARSLLGDTDRAARRLRPYICAHPFRRADRAPRAASVADQARARPSRSAGSCSCGGSVSCRRDLRRLGGKRLRRARPRIRDRDRVHALRARTSRWSSGSFFVSLLTMRTGEPSRATVVSVASSRTRRTGTTVPR